MVKVINQLKRFRNIACNVVHLLSRSVVILALVIGFMSVVGLALYIWGAPLNRENIQIVFDVLPMSYKWPFYFSLGYLIITTLFQRTSWKVLPLEVKP